MVVFRLEEDIRERSAKPRLFLGVDIRPVQDNVNGSHCVGGEDPNVNAEILAKKERHRKKSVNRGKRSDMVRIPQEQRERSRTVRLLACGYHVDICVTLSRVMDLDNRYYVRYLLEEPVIENWRRQLCLSKLASSRREAIYAAALPFFAHVAHVLVEHFAWITLHPSPDVAFHVQNSHDPTVEFLLPIKFDALLEKPRSWERMFEALFAARFDPVTHSLQIQEPLLDVFRLCQLLMPGSFMVVDAEYVSHDVDDEGEVCMMRWKNSSSALPPLEWIDHQATHSKAIVEVFGQDRWAALRRAAVDSSFLISNDITFS